LAIPRFALLFVDDDAEILSMLELLFSGKAYSILTAPDAETGLSLLERGRSTRL
jgi:DNA-binding response OmpR family regulator